MNRLVAIFLLFILLIAVAGYHAVYFFYLQQVKTEMKHFLLTAPSKYVITFKIAVDDAVTLSQIVWEEDHEFSFKGNMYDVIQKRKEGSYLIVKCIADEKETALINQYQQLNQGDQPSSDPKWVALYKWIDTYFMPCNALSNEVYLLSSEKAFLPLLLHVYTCYFPVITPPPQLA